MFMQKVKLAKFLKLQKIRRGEGKDWERGRGRMGGKERDRERQRETKRVREREGGGEEQGIIGLPTSRLTARHHQFLGI